MREVRRLMTFLHAWTRAGDSRRPTDSLRRAGSDVHPFSTGWTVLGLQCAAGKVQAVEAETKVIPAGRVSASVITLSFTPVPRQPPPNKVRYNDE